MNECYDITNDDMNDINITESSGNDLPPIGDNQNIAISKLTPELIHRAEVEVNEKENWKERDIQALREIVQNEELLNSQSDDAFLLRYLRARMFDYDKALHLIKQYYYLMANNPELFVPPKQLKCVFDSQTMCVLPKKCRSGEAVYAIRAGRWNPRKFNFDSLVAASIVTLEKAAIDEVVQINGLLCVIDMTDFGWSQLRRFGPSQAKKMVHIIDECLPIRFKAIHIVHESTLADIAFTILKPFLSEELRQKITFHGSDLTQLHQILAPDILPKEFGGQSGAINCEQWFDEIMSSESYLMTNRQNYGYKKVSDFSDIQELQTFENSLFRKSQTCNGYLFDYYKPSRVE
ncbi:alpha-tocopherol transfer protein-like [Oppia nitens]|uniref:alpha-tocopherol transfer protein-like n=1 Tax=Oppia nitens TaxID=1686743 RepID=UPI0023D9F7F6|nr:alpha-tocopherol transfer protein-like [Oppia nitens]